MGSRGAGGPPGKNGDDVRDLLLSCRITFSVFLLYSLVLSCLVLHTGMFIYIMCFPIILTFYCWKITFSYTHNCLCTLQKSCDVYN